RGETAGNQELRTGVRQLARVLPRGELEQLLLAHVEAGEDAGVAAPLPGEHRGAVQRCRVEGDPLTARHLRRARELHGLAGDDRVADPLVALAVEDGGGG